MRGSIHLHGFCKIKEPAPGISMMVQILKRNEYHLDKQTLKKAELQFKIRSIQSEWVNREETEADKEEISQLQETIDHIDI